MLPPERTECRIAMSKVGEEMHILDLVMGPIVDQDFTLEAGAYLYLSFFNDFPHIDSERGLEIVTKGGLVVKNPNILPALTQINLDILFRLLALINLRGETEDIDLTSEDIQLQIEAELNIQALIELL